MKAWPSEHHAWPPDRPGRGAVRSRPAAVPFHQLVDRGVPHHHLHEAVGAGDEVAVGVGRQQRHVVDVVSRSG